MRFKGAFQVSLTMIIGVVFAIIILGLAISWITGSFGGIETISEQALQQAKANLRQGGMDKVIFLFGKEKVRLDKAVQGMLVIRNDNYRLSYFKVVITPPEQDGRELFVVEGRETVIPIRSDEIGEHQFVVYGSEYLEEWMNEVGRSSLPVLFYYEVYVCTEDSRDRCRANDDDVWEYYAGGNAPLTVVKQT